MPEMTFDVQWPDGRVQCCYSPSPVMHDDDRVGLHRRRVDRSATARHEASERVLAKFGFACSSAAWATEEITSAATEFPSNATIRIVAMQPALEKTS